MLKINNLGKDSADIRLSHRAITLGLIKNYPIKKCCVLLSVIFSALLCSCAVGPDYKRPTTAMPAHYKEMSSEWKIATPKDQYPRGEWWSIFADARLNGLETELNRHNQNIAIAAANYAAARALVDEARANYFPHIDAYTTLSRQKQTSSSTTATAASSTTTTSHVLNANASWETDLWGNVRRSVEANRATAEAQAALLAATRLAEQASLAQYYFELLALDRDQILLDKTRENAQQILTLTKNRYAAGVASRADILAAQTQLENAAAQAINNNVNRAQYEHALAVLIGKAPADFSLPRQKQEDNSRKPNLDGSITAKTLLATIPIQLPSSLLEHRPDVAKAEREAAATNANIGVAKAAYFPNFTLNASATAQNNGLSHWFSLPKLAWAVGPELAATIFDGGARSAAVKVARANYQASVATYRQTVLAALQDVEDNLATARILSQEAVVLEQSMLDSKKELQITQNEYRAGTVYRADLLAAENAVYAAEKSLVDLNGLQMTAAIGLIKALGGGWNAKVSPSGELNDRTR